MQGVYTCCSRGSETSHEKRDPALDVVTEYIATVPFEESWASERTILRTEQLIDMMELVLLKEHLR